MLSIALARRQCTYRLVMAVCTRSSARCQSWQSRYATRRSQGRLAVGEAARCRAAGQRPRLAVVTVVLPGVESWANRGGTGQVLLHRVQDGQPLRDQAGGQLA